MYIPNIGDIPIVDKIKENVIDTELRKAVSDYKGSGTYNVIEVYTYRLCTLAHGNRYDIGYNYTLRILELYKRRIQLEKYKKHNFSFSHYREFVYEIPMWSRDKVHQIRNEDFKIAISKVVTSATGKKCTFVKSSDYKHIYKLVNFRGKTISVPDIDITVPKDEIIILSSKGGSQVGNLWRALFCIENNCSLITLGISDDTIRDLLLTNEKFIWIMEYKMGRHMEYIFDTPYGRNLSETMTDQEKNAMTALEVALDLL